jgi:hypothetical protein
MYTKVWNVREHSRAARRQRAASPQSSLAVVDADGIAGQPEAGIFTQAATAKSDKPGSRSTASATDT